MTATTQEIIHKHATDEGTEVFYSRARALRLVRRPDITHPTAAGQWLQAQKSLVYEFAPNGHLVVRHGQDMLPDGPGGEMQDAVAWLTAHPQLNHLFHWEGHEAGRALPIERDFLRDVNGALVDRDLGKLEAMYERERSTHGRTLLMDAAASAMKALRSTASEPVETPSVASEGQSREDMIKELRDKGIDVPEDVTDEQLEAALLMTRD